MNPNEAGAVSPLRDDQVGFSAHEVVTDEPTFSARLRWAVVVSSTLSPGQVANAVACVAAATSSSAANLTGPGGPDAGGSFHAGLPWAGCTIYSAPVEKLRKIRIAAANADGVSVADMPRAAQSTRVYDEYLGALAADDPTEIEYAAVSVLGPRKAVGKLVGSLPLL